MRKTVDVFIACEETAIAEETARQLTKSPVLRSVCMLTDEEKDCGRWATMTMDGSLRSTATMQRIAERAEAPYVLLLMKPTPYTVGEGMLERMMRVAADASATMVYSDYYERKSVEGKTVTERHPTIDYQKGSIRDDFNFGSIVMLSTKAMKKWATASKETSYTYGGFYDLRLFLSREGAIFHLGELLYTEEERDSRASGVKQFDYVNPANREVQIEMERVATAHLKEIGALVDVSMRRDVDFDEQEFDVEASVIIPVYNRAKTIRDAVKSAMEQQTTFPFNVIVVDNHSTDGTTEILESGEFFAEQSGRAERHVTGFR